MNCYFSEKLNAAFRIMKVQKSNIVHLGNVVIAQNNYGRKDKFDRHFENCTSHPGCVYNFNKQCLLTFEENLKYKKDIPLAAYIDFKTAVPTDECLGPKNNTS